ncbi:MAG: DnaB-like helicase C-terminal domain-containing protein, partial [Candidatus Nanopelagicus sp.]
YEKYSAIPSFDDLELTLREGPASKTLATLRLTEVPDVSAEVALDALIDQYTQNETIKLLDKFVDKLPLYDTNEIKENLATIALTIEEKTHTSEKVFTMADMMMFSRPEDLEKERVYLGLNNSFDSVLGGVARQELILIGGKRGSGKSIASSNLFVNQYESGNSSIYFSIEMTAKETMERNLSILANVNLQNLKQHKLTDDELLRVVKCRAEMFVDGQDLVSDFLRHRDRFKFEELLVRNCSLKPDNQMIIVDDRDLTLSSIDLHIGKAKAKFGDKLKLVVVDYLNQIVLEGNDQYDWKPQIEVSKKLKNLARKYEIVMVSPYQIDASGEARFAKGILDAADIAITMEAHDKETNAISFETTKIRGGKEMAFTCPIDWDTLRISPQSVDRPQAKEPVKKTGKKTTETTTVNDSSADLPWNA